jgi:hypothetical protein
MTCELERVAQGLGRVAIVIHDQNGERTTS